MELRSKHSGAGGCRREATRKYRERERDISFDEHIHRERKRGISILMKIYTERERDIDFDEHIHRERERGISILMKIQRERYQF